MKKIAFLFLITIIITFGCSCAGDNQAPLDPDNHSANTIEIVSGATAESIGLLLEEENIIANGKDFKNFLKANGYDVKLQAGAYKLSPSMDYSTLAEILVGGKVATTSFTVPEGLTIEQTAKKLAEQGLGEELKFLDAITNQNYSYEWIPTDSEGELSLEGYLLPNTFTIPEGLSEYEIIDFLLSQFDKYVYQAYKERSDELKQTEGMNFHQLITIASIIERECKVQDERALVSSVIYNRLSKGMALQMCSTVQYLLLQETGEVKETLLYRDLEIDSPYNTYKYAGLPPGPICSPGLACIYAAFYPAQTDYLYFVLSDQLDGTSKFSSNYQQFNRDKSAYDKAAR